MTIGLEKMETNHFSILRMDKMFRSKPVENYSEVEKREIV